VPGGQTGWHATSGSADASRRRTGAASRSTRAQKPSGGLHPDRTGLGVAEGGAYAQGAVLAEHERDCVHGGRGPQEGVEDARQERLDVVVHQRGGGDAIESAQRALARFRVPYHRGGDGLIDRVVQPRQLR
jgi:hypothetical protein